MSLTFLFWFALVYTLLLFGVQVHELLTPGQAHWNVSILNAFYLALMSAYVGGKEFKRWKNGEGAVVARPWWLQGEWMVGLWAGFLPVAVILPQQWPARFGYPEGLTTISFEVLGFYIGSSASTWLSKTKESRTHEELDQALSRVPSVSAEPEQQVPRLVRKRERYEKKIVEAARAKGGVTREEVEKLVNLSRAASLRLLGDMMDKGLITREGDPGARNTLYRAA